MQKIIVTGGLGFIGSNLIELLIHKKFKVINIDKATYSSNYYNTKEYQKNSNYKFIKCDLNNIKKLDKIIGDGVKKISLDEKNMLKKFKYW